MPNTSSNATSATSNTTSNANATQNALIVATAAGDIACKDATSQKLVNNLIKGKKRKAKELMDTQKLVDRNLHGYNIGDEVLYGWGPNKSVHTVVDFYPVLGPAHPGTSTGKDRDWPKKAVPWDNTIMYKQKYADSDDDDE